MDYNDHLETFRNYYFTYHYPLDTRYECFLVWESLDLQAVSVPSVIVIVWR